MMASTNTNTNVNIRMDRDLKREFEAFCADMGMSMTTAFTIFAKKAVREYRIPFEIGSVAPNATTMAALREAEQLARDPSVKRYTDVEEALQALKE